MVVTYTQISHLYYNSILALHPKIRMTIQNQKTKPKNQWLKRVFGADPGSRTKSRIGSKCLEETHNFKMP